MWPFRKQRGKPAPHKQDVLASEVHPKGVTRPHHRLPDPISTEVAHRVQLDRALHAFMSADNWTATHAVLVRDQALLLSDEALSILADFVEQARQQPQPPGSAGMVAYLEAHRILVSRARRVGIDQAWLEFQATHVQEMRPADHQELASADPESQAIGAALKHLLGTESWNETYAAFVRDQALLLTETADQFLSALIQVARQDHSPHGVEGVHYLEMHRTLLREARTHGIDVAWEHFDHTRRQLESSQEQHALPSAGPPHAIESAVAAALKALLTTESWADTRKVLEHSQHLLLTDDCDYLLNDLLAAAQRDLDPNATRSAVYLRLHQRLLRMARREGIAVAWRDFEEALEIASAPDDRSLRSRLSAILPPPQLEVAEAVQIFLNAASWTEARRILELHQQTLLSAAAVTEIQRRAETLHAQGAGRDLYAARLLKLQARLLQRARTVGINQAWAEFESERD